VLCLNRWVRHVVMCQVQRFRLENFYYGEYLMLDDLPLVSRHLTRLELVGIELVNQFCDFSSCPSLRHLDIAHCYLWHAKKLSSQSMISLSITSCDFTTEFNTLLIHGPSLVSLNLDSHMYRPPVLGSLPSLKKAFVRVPVEEYCCDGSDAFDCYSCHIMIEHNQCFLLDGLSNAENLALLSETKMVKLHFHISQLFLCPSICVPLWTFIKLLSNWLLHHIHTETEYYFIFFCLYFIQFIFEKDLKRCPTFSNLKTLLLNDHWCVAPHFLALTCILKHSPVLEKLTLELNSRVCKCS
jgi:hypothetical protein